METHVDNSQNTTWLLAIYPIDAVIVLLVHSAASGASLLCVGEPLTGV